MNDTKQPNGNNEKENLPLSGKKILVTRTTRGNLVEKKKLEKLGAKVVELNSIEIRPPSSYEKLDQALRHLSYFDWIIFTSANGVKAFFDRAQKIKTDEQIRRLLARTGKTNLACVGPATREALEERIGERKIFVPKNFLTSNLAKELAEKFDMRGKKLVLARAEVANKAMATRLRKAGASVNEVAVYKTVPRRNKIKGTLLDGVTDITLTSPSAVEGLLGAFPSREIEMRKIQLHCIGPVTAKSALEHHLDLGSVAKVHTLDGLVRALVEFYSRQNHR